MRPILRRIPVIRNRFRHDIEPPEWSGDPAGKRILVEEEDSALRRAMGLALREAGFQTAECAGPGSHGDGRCPLVEGVGCPAVDEADAVLQVLVPSDEAMNEVRAIIHSHKPDLPITVIAPAATAARHPDLVADTTVSHRSLSRQGVVDAAEAAVESN